MPDPNTTQDPAVDAATPDVSATPPASESGKGEAAQVPSSQTESGSEPSGDDSQNVSSSSSEPSDENLTVEELRKKYSESSKEARLRKEEAELANRRVEEETRKTQQLQENLLSVITENRDTFERYLNNQGFSPAEKEQYLNYYDTQIAKGEQPTAPGQAPVSQQATETPQSPSTPPANPVRERWMREKDQEEATKIAERQKASKEFLEDPSNKELDQVTLNAIWNQAEYLDTKHGSPPAEALKSARRLVVEADSLKDEGYVEGLRDAYVGGVSKGVSGGSSSKGSAFTLSKKDQAFVEAEIADEGLTGQAAEDFRRQYALRVQKAKE